MFTCCVFPHPLIDVPGIAPARRRVPWAWFPLLPQLLLLLLSRCCNPPNHLCSLLAARASQPRVAHRRPRRPPRLSYLPLPRKARARVSPPQIKGRKAPVCVRDKRVRMLCVVYTTAMGEERPRRSGSRRGDRIAKWGGGADQSNAATTTTRVHQSPCGRQPPPPPPPSSASA